MKGKLSIIISLLLLSAVSCIGPIRTAEPQIPEAIHTIALRISEDNLYNGEFWLEGDCESFDIEVYTNAKIGVNISEQWIRIADTKGASTSIFRFIAEENNSSERRARITFYDTEDQSNYVDLIIWQDAKLEKNEDKWRHALIALYQETGGDNWQKKENWCSDKPVSEWEGVISTSRGNPTGLSLSSNNLTGGISAGTLEGIATTLTSLDLGSNDLEYCDVSRNTRLADLDISNNRLTSLSVGNGLSSLWCSGNRLTSISLEGMSRLHGLRANNNPVLESIRIQDCESLTSVESNNSGLKEIYVSNCPDITNMSFNNSRLTGIDVSALKHLSSLSLRHCDMHSLDLCANDRLVYLFCDYNDRLDEIRFGDNRLLSYLITSNTALKSLDLSSMSNLISLDVSNTPLTGLDITRNHNLAFLSAFNDLPEYYPNRLQMKEIDFSGCPGLLYLNVSGIGLESIDLSNNKSIETLSVNCNKLSKLDLSALEMLTWLNCRVNSLTQLDLSGNALMENLVVSENMLTSLDVSSCSSLKVLRCISNNLSELDIRGLANLGEVYCNGNPDLAVIYQDRDAAVFYQKDAFTVVNAL